MWLPELKNISIKFVQEIHRILSKYTLPNRNNFD